MIRLLYIMAGGAIGSALRFGLSGFTQRLISGTFPIGTMVVNIIGSFIAGVLWGITEFYEFPPMLRLFAFIGFLGGFTTFSTYTLETMNLIRSQRYLDAGINILASNLLGIFFIIAGFIGFKLVFNYLLHKP